MYSFLLGLVLVGFVGSSPTGSEGEVKIVGGNDIDIKEVPYQVSLMFMGRHSCGGAIISNDIVITAAHCVIGTPAKEFQIRAGTSSSSKGGQIVPVGNMVVHPDFNVDMDSDVAVLWLSKPLQFSESIQPVGMLKAREEIRDGELTMVTGWGNTLPNYGGTIQLNKQEEGGYPSTLQMVMVPKVNSKICDEAYSPMYEITPRMLCAGAPQGGKDACQGDSGGPLVYNGKLAGIVSWGLGCARPDYPGVYAKVSALRSWIDDNIAYLRMSSVLRAD